MTEETRRRAYAPFAWLFVALALVTFFATLPAEEKWRRKHAWESFKKEQEAKGVSFDRESVIPPTVPDEQNFAMTPFLAPLSEFVAFPEAVHSVYRDPQGVQRAQKFADDAFAAPKEFQPWLKRKQFDWTLYLRSNSPDSPFSSPREAAIALLTNFEKYQPVLDELRAASHRPYCRFNIAYHDADTAGMLLPHLGVLKKLAQVRSLETCAEIVLGNSKAAADDLDQTFFLADSIKDEPILISHLVRLAILNVAVSDLSNGISQHVWSDRQLQDFQARIEKIRLIPEMDRCLNGERVESVNPMFDMLRKNPNYLAGLAGDNDQSSTVASLRFWPPGWLYSEQLNYNKLFLAEFRGAYDVGESRVYPSVARANYSQVTNQIVSRGIVGSILHHELYSRLLLGSLNRVIQKSARAQTIVDEADVACALERYRLANGQYPDSLTALTPQYLAAIPNDVISGDPLKYRRTEDGQYVLYSVGWNETDDGGTIVYIKNGKSPDPDQGDWVWASNQ